jgi:hypothetical protein
MSDQPTKSPATRERKPKPTGFIRLDDRRRAPLGKYTELVGGGTFRVDRAESGVLTLTPAVTEAAA